MAAASGTPTLPADVPWLGASGPPVLGDGRVGVVLFWSATSVHGERALAVLDWLDVRFAGRPLVLASVHVPRADEERGPEFVARACARFGVRHPVAVDDDRRVLARWGGRALPTLVLVDAEGTVRFRGGGEPDRDRLTAAVEALLDDAHAPPPPAWPSVWPEPLPRAATELRSPSGVAVDEGAGLLWIADTGRHRVLAVALEDGTLRHVVGSGCPGATGGDFAYAAFCGPRGLAAADGDCYVADAGNHLVRKIDGHDLAVDDVLGKGRLVADTAGGLAGAQQGIASPWDVELVGGDLYVAMAGVHQVWQLTLGDGYAYAWTGLGHPGFSDGMRHSAAFAQPAALAFACDELAIADADNGAVRVGGVSTQHVHTVFGSPGGARLLQPRGIAWHRGDVLVADALGDRIVRVRPRDGSIEEVVGPGAGLRGPEGLAVYGDRLFVADVGNHRIACVDLATGAVGAVPIVDPHPDHPEPPPPPLLLRARSKVSLCFPMPSPPDERLHPQAVGHARARTLAGAPLARSFAGAVDPQGSWGTVRDVETGDVGDGEIEVTVRFATCHDPGDEPHVQELHGRFEVRVEPEGEAVVDLPFR